MANLVLNGKSIDNIDDIAENFVEADILREFKSGSLAAWLEEYGYEEELERVKSIKPTASSIRILSGIIDALNLDDGVIAQANARREEQQRKEEAVQKAREELQRKEEETRLRREHEEQQKKEEEERKRREREEQQRREREERQKKDEEAQQRSEHSEQQSIANNGLSENDDGVGLPQWPLPNWNWQSVLDIYEKAAEQGNPRAQARLAMYFRQQSFWLPGDDPDDCRFARARGYYWAVKGAEKGDIVAQTELGTFYKNGWGVGKDQKQAIKWYTIAAEQGGESALKALVYFYDGVETFEKAFALVEKAATRGLVWAQAELGRRYFCGEGIDKNRTKAAQWFQRAAEQENARAQLSLAICYYTGAGVLKDREKARQLRNAAAEQCVDVSFVDMVAGIREGKISNCDEATRRSGMVFCRDYCSRGSNRCSLCAKQCPVGAIDCREINTKACTHCGICAVVCPDEYINWTVV